MDTDASSAPAAPWGAGHGLLRAQGQAGDGLEIEILFRLLQIEVAVDLLGLTPLVVEVITQAAGLQVLVAALEAHGAAGIEGAADRVVFDPIGEDSSPANRARTLPVATARLSRVSRACASAVSWISAGKLLEAVRASTFVALPVRAGVLGCSALGTGGSGGGTRGKACPGVNAGVGSTLVAVPGAVTWAKSAERGRSEASSLRISARTLGANPTQASVPSRPRASPAGRHSLTKPAETGLILPWPRRVSRVPGTGDQTGHRNEA